MNTDALPRELHTKATDFLTRSLPNDADARKAVVSTALYGVSLPANLVWNDPHSVFVQTLVAAALRFGSTGDGTPALCVLITESAAKLGINRQAEARFLSEEIAHALGAAAPGQKSAVWNIPKPNPAFTGREDTLKEITASFDKSPRVALIGIAGAGKTQIARKYAASVQKSFAYGFEIVAESADTLRDGLVGIAKVIHPAVLYDNAPDRAVADAHSFLKTHANALVIVDNVDDAAVWLDFAWNDWDVHILLTGRDADAAFGMECVTVDTVTKEAGAALIREYLNPAARKQAAPGDLEAISEVLDGLPLALAQAGAYISTTRTSAASYLRDIQRDIASQMPLVDDDGRLQRGNVAATVNKTLERLKKDNPAAWEILQWCAYLVPDAIPDRIFRQQATTPHDIWRVVSPAFLECVGDDDAWNAAVAALDKLGMLTGREYGVSFSLHRTTAAALRALTDDGDLSARLDKVCALLSAAYDYTANDKWDYMAAMMPHFLACVDKCDQNGVTRANAGHMAARAASMLQDRGEYDRSVSLRQQAEAIFTTIEGEEGSTVWTIRYNQSQTLTLAGRYAEATALLETVLAFQEAHLGATDPKTGQTLHQLASAYVDAGEYARAEPLYRRSLKIQEANGDAETPGYSATLNDLGVLCHHAGRRGEAQDWFERGLTLLRRIMPPYHPYVATTLYNRARFHHDAGDARTALPFYQEAAAIYRKHLPANHPQRLSVEQMYARCLRDLGITELPAAVTGQS